MLVVALLLIGSDSQARQWNGCSMLHMSQAKQWNACMMLKWGLTSPVDLRTSRRPYICVGHTVTVCTFALYNLIWRTSILVPAPPWWSPMKLLRLEQTWNLMEIEIWFYCDYRV